MITRYCACGEPIYTKSRRCNPCAVVFNRNSQQSRIESGTPRSSVYNYKRREARPKEYILSNAKSRAAKKGWAFDLTVDDFEIPSVCPVLGLPLCLEAGVGTKDTRPSLDRIDSSKGYVKGNVQILSWRANNLKSDGTLDEFRKLVEFLDGHRA